MRLCSLADGFAAWAVGPVINPNRVWKKVRTTTVRYIGRSVAIAWYLRGVRTTLVSVSRVGGGTFFGFSLPPALRREKIKHTPMVVFPVYL